MGNRVAIILSTYNGEKYIKEQIDSIMSQSFNDFDLFIHDDGSTDSTACIIKDYSNKFDNIKVIVEKAGLKYPSCFIEMLKVVEGYRFYAFSDQDDVWESCKLSEAIQCLETKDRTRPILYYASVEYTDSNLKHIRNSRFAEGKDEVCKLGLQSLLFGGEAMGMTFVFNDVAKRALVNANETKAYKDWFLKLYCAACGEVYYNPHPSARYRRHASAVTNDSNPSGKFERYLSQVYEIYFKKDTFNTQKSILNYLKKNCTKSILKENQDLIELFSCENTLIKKLKKLTWKKRFRTKIMDEIGYRVAFFIGRI